MAVRLRTWIAALVALAGFLLLAYFLWTSGVEPGDIVSALLGVHPGFLAAALTLSLTELGLRVLRFQRILAHMDRSVPMGRLITAQLVGMFAGNLSPSRVGEPLKALVLRRDQVPIPVGIVATILERLLDLTVLALMLALSIVLSVSGPLLFSLGVALALAAAFAAAYVAIVILLPRGVVHRWTRKLADRWIRMRPLSDALDSVTFRGKGFGLRSLEWAVLSVVILVVDVAILQVLFWGYGVDIAFLVILGLLAVATLGGIASQAPGGLGTTEAILVALFVNAGVVATAALGATLLARIFSFYLFTIAGWVLSVRAGLTWSDAEPAA